MNKCKHERICVVCSTKWISTCADEKENTWKRIYCSEDCRSIFNICSQFKANKISKEEAREKLDSVKVPSMDKLAKSLNDDIKEIRKGFSSPTPSSEEVSVEVETTESEDDSFFSYKKNRRKDK